MSFDADLNKTTGKADDRAALDGPQRMDGGLDQDPALEAALRDFRLSVHAWSEVAYTRPRLVPQPVRRKVWRTAGSWALGGVLAAGIAGGTYVEHRHRQETARIAAVQEAARLHQLAEQHAREAEEELARVDTDVARQVPHAMETLAQLMSEDEAQ